MQRIAGHAAGSERLCQRNEMQGNRDACDGESRARENFAPSQQRHQGIEHAEAVQAYRDA